MREARAPGAAMPSVRDAAGAALTYAPRLTVFAGRREGAFGAGLEVGGSVAQELSVRGLGGARRETAAALDRVTRRNLDRARLEAAATALVAWLDVLEVQELLALRCASRADAEEIARVASARTARGVAMPIEASLAAAEVGNATLGERDAEGRLVEVRASLKLALGLPASSDVVATGDLASDDAPSEPATPRRAHPAEAAARSYVELAHADARLAHAVIGPPLALGLNYAREGTGEQYLTATVIVPLPFLDPSRFEVARQSASSLAAEARATRLEDELARDVALTMHERVHTREVRDILRVQVLVPLRETVRLARASYQAGTQDATTFLLLRQRLVSAEEQLAHAAAEVKRADVRAAVARGTLVDGGAR